MRKKRRTQSSKTSRSRKSTSSKKSQSTTLDSSQKRLKDRQTPPWDRLKSLGYKKPFIYDIPWEDRAIAQILHAENVSGLGYVSEGLAKYGEEYHVHPYSWASFVERKIKNDPTAHPTGEHEDRYVLREDQKEDVTTVLAARSTGAPEFLIANETGTGKTVTAWSAVQKLHPKSVLIVCPAAVIPVWRQHVKDMGDKGMDIVVINYESLRNLISPPDQAVKAKKPATQNKNIALYGEPYTTFDVIIFDEAHKMKNPTSQQSRISNTLAKHAKFIIKLTATPGKDPSQLHYMWRGLSWVTQDPIKVIDENNFDEYVKWCHNNDIHGIVEAPFGNGIKWDGEKEDLINMEKILYGKKDGIAWSTRRKSGLEIVRQPLLVDLSAKDREMYDKIVEDVKAEIMENISKNRKDLSKGLAAMMALRQKTGLLKVKSVVEYTKYAINDLNEQVVISSFFHNTTDALAKYLDDENIKYVIIDGTISIDEKEKRRLQFQQGDVPVVITSVKEGISLHANEDSSHATSNSRRLIFADTQWSPGNHLQIEGRISRNNQAGSVTIPYLSDTIDEKMTTTLLTGLASQSIIQGDNQEDQLRLLAHEMGINLKF